MTNLEKVALWLEDQSRIATNSLHCGDNSLTIQRTHAWAASLDEAVAALRAAARPAQDEMENYRLALAWIKDQSTDPHSREVAETALLAGETGK